jgi:hypothetical protein
VGGSDDTIEAQLGLADARWQLGERRRAISIAETAHRRALAATNPSVRAHADVIAAWLREHRRGRSR